MDEIYLSVGVWSLGVGGYVAPHLSPVLTPGFPAFINRWVGRPVKRENPCSAVGATPTLSEGNGLPGIMACS